MNVQLVNHSRCECVCYECNLSSRVSSRHRWQVVDGEAFIVVLMMVPKCSLPSPMLVQKNEGL